MEVQGKIKVINETQSFGSNGFTKRDLVVETQEQYPQPILIEFHKDKCNLLDAYNVGDNVKVSINLRGRLWESPTKGDVYFNSIQGWRIEKVEGEAVNEVPTVPQPKVEDDDSGLPF